MDLNLRQVATHLRANNSEEEDHIENLMDLAVNEVERIAGGAPESIKEQSSLLWISWAFTHRVTVLEIRLYPQIAGTNAAPYLC